MLVLGRDQEVARLVGDRLGGSFDTPLVAFGFGDDEGGPLAGGVVFHDWNGSNVEATVAMDRPIRHGEINGLRHYAFDQLKARRITFKMEASNQRAVRFCHRRATIEALLPQFYESGDGLQFAVLADDLRWAKWKVEV